jgi:2-methylcitrate dehydratase PrpD
MGNCILHLLVHRCICFAPDRPKCQVIAKLEDQPEIRRLWPLVKVHRDEELEAAYPDEKKGCIVRVTTRDGAQYEGRVDHAKGEPENMLSDLEFEEKFRRLVGDFLPDDRLGQMFDMVFDLEKLDDVGELIRLTAKSMRKVRM